MMAVACSTFLKRFAAAVRSRTAANGDSTTLVVRRCFRALSGTGRTSRARERGDRLRMALMLPIPRRRRDRETL